MKKVYEFSISLHKTFERKKQSSFVRFKVCNRQKSLILTKIRFQLIKIGISEDRIINFTNTKYYITYTPKFTQLCHAGAYPGFLKGGGKEPAQSASFEPNAVNSSGGMGAQPLENFVLNYVLNQ